MKRDKHGDRKGHYPEVTPVEPPVRLTSKSWNGNILHVVHSPVREGRAFDHDASYNVAPPTSDAWKTSPARWSGSRLVKNTKTKVRKQNKRR